jgi:hypothetical protein
VQLARMHVSGSMCWRRCWFSRVSTIVWCHVQC